MDCPLPIFGICGFSGAGKTTLIEALLPRLQAQGLRVAVLKHDVHGIEVDRAGKDSDRFFRGGADVVLQGPGEVFVRSHGWAPEAGWQELAELAVRYDLILAEGHKNVPWPKLWVACPRDSGPPPEIENILAILPRDTDRVGQALAVLQPWLMRQWTAIPVWGCVLIGGQSTRMGQPKHLLPADGRTWLERTVEVLGAVTNRVVLAGGGEVPAALAELVRVPDVPGVEGPMAGILAAMRWAPWVSWIVAACDLPNLSTDAVHWLIGTRAPGTWATMPRLPGTTGVEPLLAHYDFRARLWFEALATQKAFGLHALANNRKVATPEPPPPLVPAWRNVNEPGDLATVR